MVVYYDLTDLLEYGRDNVTVSGIQRTTLTLLNILVNKHGPENVRVVALHPNYRDVRTYRADLFAGSYQFDQQAFIEQFQLRLSLGQFCGTLCRGRWYQPALEVVLKTVNAIGGGRLYRALHIADHETPARRLAADGEIAFTAGDVVFVGGATWNYRRLYDFYDRKRRQDGIAVIQFIHDLIPLTSPQYCVSELPPIFGAWLARLQSRIDGFIANSESTRADLDAWMRAHAGTLPTEVVRLAHQFGRSPRPQSPGEMHCGATASVGAAVRQVVLEPYVLCVGTMEARKNNLMLAKAWQGLKQRLGDRTPRLVFAGSKGWLNDGFERFVEESGSLGGTIVILQRPSDAELAFLYRHCLFSAFVSHKEGWGLPIGEGLWFGRPVLCSRVSSMPEVGGDLADYIDPASVESIEIGALRLITDDAYREQRAAAIQAARLRTWEDVADDLWATLIEAGKRR